MKQKEIIKKMQSGSVIHIHRIAGFISGFYLDNNYLLKDKQVWSLYEKSIIGPKNAKYISDAVELELIIEVF
jgi:hypothetical protein